MTIRELWHISSNESIIRDTHYDHHLSDGKVLVKSLYSMISTGTERLVSLGMVPVDMQLLMKVPYMDGYLGLPVKYGYSLIGEIIEGSSECTGKLVHLMHPHQDYAIVDLKDVTFIPHDMPLIRACFATNLETALNAIWDSDITAGDNVLVCGFGLIGALVSMLASQFPGVKVSVHEIDPERKSQAEKLGFSEVVPGKGFDVAINASGSEEGLQLCIDRTIHGGVITELSWYGTAPVKLNLGSSFHVGQKKLISSQASVISLDKSHRFDKKRRKHIVMDLLKCDCYDKLPVNMVSFDAMPEIFSKIRKKTYKPLCTVVKY